MKVEFSPTESTWTSVQVEVSEASAPVFCDRLWSLGAEGVTEDHPGLHFAEGNELYVTDEWEVPEPENPITGWFRELSDRTLIRASLAELADKEGLAEATTRFERVAEQDWSALWKEGWTVTRLTDRLLVVPE